jgi:hypothetical protein
VQEFYSFHCIAGCYISTPDPCTTETTSIASQTNWNGDRSALQGICRINAGRACIISDSEQKQNHCPTPRFPRENTAKASALCAAPPPNCYVNDDLAGAPVPTGGDLLGDGRRPPARLHGRAVGWLRIPRVGPRRPRRPPGEVAVWNWIVSECAAGRGSGTSTGSGGSSACHPTSSFLGLSTCSLWRRCISKDPGGFWSSSQVAFAPEVFSRPDLREFFVSIHRTIILNSCYLYCAC